MALWLIFVLLLSAFTGLSHQASRPEDSFYIAGVVEFSPAAVNQSSLDQLNNNLRDYLNILSSSEALKTDIIVFPELTLNNVFHMTYVPDPEYAVVPCGNGVYESFFQQLSCAARSVEKYVVINVIEKEICTTESQAAKNDPRPCATSGLSTFNTNVVFNRNGTVVARYRKFHVYQESRNVTYKPELSTFDTDFGVTFGQFICFDINFYSPAMDLVKSGVKDLIFTSFWYSELPFLTAVQLQQGWAFANNVNLLSAGASYPSIGSTGTGIYAGERGALVSVMANTPERKLYVANVTKFSHLPEKNAQTKGATLPREVPKKRNLNGIKLMQEYKVNEFTSVPLKLDNITELRENVCHGEFCCSFFFKVNKLPPPRATSSYQYQMAAFDGDRQYSGNGYTRYKFCAVFACTNSSSSSCGMVFDDSVTVSPEFSFQTITMEANFDRTEKVLYMPSSVDQNLYPLPVEYSDFHTHHDKDTHVRYHYEKEINNLLTFGIYANFYNSGPSLQAVSLTAFIVSLLVVRFY